MNLQIIPPINILKIPSASVYSPSSKKNTNPSRGHPNPSDKILPERFPVGCSVLNAPQWLVSTERGDVVALPTTATRASLRSWAPGRAAVGNSNKPQLVSWGGMMVIFSVERYRSMGMLLVVKKSRLKHKMLINLFQNNDNSACW